MMTLATASALLVALGLFFSLVMAIAQRAMLQAPAPPPPAQFPPVTILKQL